MSNSQSKPGTSCTKTFTFVLGEEGVTQFSDRRTCGTDKTSLCAIGRYLVIKEINNTEYVLFSYGVKSLVEPFNNIVKTYQDNDRSSIPYTITNDGENDNVYEGVVYIGKFYSKVTEKGIITGYLMDTDIALYRTIGYEVNGIGDSIPSGSLALFSDPELQNPLTTFYCADCSKKKFGSDEKVENNDFRQV